MSCDSKISISIHDLKQPLNVIRLVSDNVKARILPQLNPAEAEYLAGKLARIDGQVDRILTFFEPESQEDAAVGEDA